MSRSADDDDHTSFIHLDGLVNAHGDPLVLSSAAFELHTAGIMNSIKDGHPGFVSDDYLNAISAETSVTATELCMAGTWRRVGRGYEIVDREMLDFAVEVDRRKTARAEHCAATCGHEPDSEYPSMCGKCNAPLEPSGWPTPPGVGE